MNKNIFKVLMIFQIGLSGVNLLAINKRVSEMLKYQPSKNLLNQNVHISLDDEFFEEALSNTQKYFNQNGFRPTYDELFSLIMHIGSLYFEPKTDFGKGFLNMAHKLNVPNDQISQILKLLISEIVEHNNEIVEHNNHELKTNPTKRLAQQLDYLNKKEFVVICLDLMFTYAHTVDFKVIMEQLETFVDCMQDSNEGKLVGLSEKPCFKTLPNVFEKIVTIAVKYNVTSEQIIKIMSSFAGEIDPDDSDND